MAAAYAEVAELAGRGALPLTLAVHPLDEIATAWAAQAASPGAKLVLRP